MPTLRKSSRSPGTYLALLGLIVAGAYADSFRRPDHQWSAHVYVALVRGYQRLGR
jgi:hypothetical protein